MLLQSENDVPGPIIVMDLEWVGNTYCPASTHVVQLACRNVATHACYSTDVLAMSSTNRQNAPCPQAAYQCWISWLEEQKGDNEVVCLVAHNGIRFDAPVLLNSMRRCGMVVPDWLNMMDSLYHLRHHTRHWKADKPPRYDIDSMCEYCGINIAAAHRHDARYDVDLLCDILQIMHQSHGIPLISGAVQSMHCLSTMLVRGIGPVVWRALPTTSLYTMCESIISQHGDLSVASCTKYLDDHGLKKSVPLCDIGTIAQNIPSAAQVHLQYIESVSNVRC